MQKPPATDLVLPVILESAVQSSETDIAENLKQKQMANEKTKRDLHRICEEMDDDGHGKSSSQELRWANKDSGMFRHLMMTRYAGGRLGTSVQNS